MTTTTLCALFSPNDDDNLSVLNGHDGIDPSLPNKKLYATS